MCHTLPLSKTGWPEILMTAATNKEMFYIPVMSASTIEDTSHQLNKEKLK
jgi:hypothetical protein